MTDLKALSDAGTQGEWMLGHYADPDHSCSCRSILADNRYFGGIARIYEPEGNGDNPPESQQIANGNLIVALVNAHRADDLVPASEVQAARDAALEEAAQAIWDGPRRQYARAADGISLMAAHSCRDAILALKGTPHE